MTKSFLIENLYCPNCAAKIERAIAQLNGVNSVKVDYEEKHIVLDAEESKLSGILSAINVIAHRVEPNCVLSEK